MDKEKYELLLHLLDNIYQRSKRLDEKLDCILHTFCENNDEKMLAAFKRYLESDFRNIQK